MKKAGKTGSMPPKAAGFIPPKAGKPAIHFKPGGLHASTGTPAGKPIPAGKMAAARSGKLGVKAERQAIFKENVLTGRKKH